MAGTILGEAGCMLPGRRDICSILAKVNPGPHLWMAQLELLLMLVVDSQVHIWAADTPDRPWPKDPPIEPHEGPLSAAKLKVAMIGAGVQRAILIPPSWEGTRNDLALSAARAEPNRFAVMGRLAIEKPEAPDRLSRWLEQPGMLGLRMNFRAEPQRSWLYDGTADWLFPALERYNIPLMVFATGSLPIMGKIAEQHPALRLIIDHMGMIVGEKGERAFEEEAELLALARHSNIAVKATAVPCAATEPYPYPSLHRHIRAVFDAYGPQRFFWGTDLTQLPCRYRQAVTLFTEELPWLSGNDLENVMGQSVCEWLRWPPE
jgi:L-fuconolactonase